jgi:hypothetical protein
MGAEAAMLSGATDSVKSLAGTPIKVAGGVMNLIEAGKQAEAKRAADRAAEEAVARAKQEQETNFLGALQVPTEAYNQALRENTAQQMQALGALQEAGPRELAGGVGRVNAVANNQANDVTNQLADRLYNLNLAQANEQGQTADAMARLYLGQAEGAQKASMAANLAEMGLKQGALSSFGGAFTGGVDALTNTYPQGKQAEAVMTQVPQMQGVVTPTTQAPMMPNTQLQGFASPEIQKMLQMLMSNPQMMR